MGELIGWLSTVAWLRRAGIGRAFMALVVLAPATGSVALAASRDPGARLRPHRVSERRAAGAAPLVTYIEMHGVVDPARSASFRGRCRGSTPTAISAFSGANSDSAVRNFALTGSAPYGRGHTGWRVAIKDRGTRREPYFLGVVCASARLRPSFVSMTGTLRAGRTGGFNVQCPKSAPTPISGFFSAMNGSGGSFILAEFTDLPPRGWVTVVKNITGQTQRYVTGAVCAHGTQVARAFMTGKLTLAPGVIEGIRGRCPNPAPYAVAGTFALPANEGSELGKITLAASYPFGAGTRNWDTVIVNLTSQAQPFFAGMICIG